MSSVVSKEHLLKAQKFKRLYSLLKENEVLIRIGAYQGGDKELDEAIKKKDFMENFLKQAADELVPFRETFNLLNQI